MTQRTHSAAEPIGIGDAVGHYRIIGVVGSGRTGNLYIAEQHENRSISKIVALRCIRPGFTKSAAFREMFLDAARIAQRFEHPNVVTIHEMGEIDGKYFVSMEYLHGENVASILTRCNTSVHVPHDIAAALVKQAANAVQYLHDLRASDSRPLGLGFGEVNPSNVFVTYHGAVKFLDLGFAVARSDEAAARGANGEDTPSHASLSGEIARVADRHEDIVNLGVLLWTCLTGQTPYLPGGNAGDRSHIPAPSSSGADVPKALDSIAMRALSPDPAQRYPSARALSEALEQYLVRREAWPSPRHMRKWIEQLFGTERASLHAQVSEGQHVEGALALLGAAQHAGSGMHVAQTPPPLRPRELWSTSHSVFSQLTRVSMVPRSVEPAPSSAGREWLPVSSVVARSVSAPPAEIRDRPAQLPEPVVQVPQPAPQSRAPAERAPAPSVWRLLAMLATGVVAMSITIWLVSPSEERAPPAKEATQAPAAGRRGRVDVRSTPEGAAVFVDGEPTGLRTPVVLKGLAEGRIRLRVEKAGFASQEREVVIAGGAVEIESFELPASAGLVVFAGAPPGASVYVDDVQVAVEAGTPVSLSAGPHSVRVEAQGTLMFSDTVVVVAGEQTIRLDGAAAAP